MPDYIYLAKLTSQGSAGIKGVGKRIERVAHQTCAQQRITLRFVPGTMASRPFDPPKTGKIAIKVTNHYGDEVLKV